MDSLFCSGHNQLLPLSSFYPSSIKSKESRCKECNTRFRTHRRQTNTLSRLQHKLYHTEHNRGGAYPSKEFIQSVLKRYDSKSAIPVTGGGNGDENLCIVRFFSDLPLSQHPWNAVLLTTSQARHLPKTPGKRELAFPEELQKDMERRRVEGIKG